MHHAGCQQLQMHKHAMLPILLTACMSGSAANSGLARCLQVLAHQCSMLINAQYCMCTDLWNVRSE